MTIATSDIKSRARGRWREILRSCGVEAKVFNGRRQPCPVCGGKDRFWFDDKRGDGNWFCQRCGSSDGFQLLMFIRGWDFPTAKDEVAAVLGNVAAKPFEARDTKPADAGVLNQLWAGGQLITKDCVAGQYLLGRGLDIDPDAFKGTLRGHDYCYHTPSHHKHPALLARFFDVQGKPRQLQRTYLTPRGGKLPVEPNRMWMPGCLPKGGAVRLGGPTKHMGVAEGVETALAARKLSGLTVWATTSDAMLRQWCPPDGVERVTIYADNDKNHAGQKAAEELACRVSKQGLEVEVKCPDTKGTDWNDVLLTSPIMVSSAFHRGASDAR